MAETIIDVDEMKKSYGAKAILTGVNLQIPRGAVVGLGRRFCRCPGLVLCAHGHGWCGGRGARGNAGRGGDGEQQQGTKAAARAREVCTHLAKISFMPPAMSRETSTSTRGSAIPPRATR